MSPLCPQLGAFTVPAGATRVTERDIAPQDRQPGAGITMNKMPRSPMQSDFVVHEPPPVEERPAGARTTKLVMTLTFIMLVVLALICAIGPHIPSGE
jgi:hypothetical protein